MQARFMNKKKILVTSILVLLLIVGSVWGYTLLRSSSSSEETPVVTVPEDDSSQNQAQDDQSRTETVKEFVADPSTVSTVDIAPLGVTVSYVKGIPGFEYVIERTQNNTQYVDFLSPQLAGTKCTDDKGVFASIVQDPVGVDAATISVSREVGGHTYGLSLPDDTCTADGVLFAQYQKSFKDAFGLLKTIEPATDSAE